jgi:hypothetical protein
MAVLVTGGAGYIGSHMAVLPLLTLFWRIIYNILSATRSLIPICFAAIDAAYTRHNCYHWREGNICQKFG